MQYHDIPHELYEYLGVSESEFNNLKGHVQNIVLREARRLYLEDHADDDDVEEEDFSDENFEYFVSEQEHEFVGRRKARWIQRCVSAETADPVTLHPGNIRSFGELIDRLRLRYTTNGFVPYQYTLAIGDNYINSIPDSTHLISLVEKYLEQYEHDFTICTFSISYKKEYRRRAYHGGIRAGNGEGIPRRIAGGYWNLDLFQTRYKCIQNSYALWLMYADGKLDDVIRGKTDTFFELRNSMKSDKNVKFDDVVLDGLDFDVMYKHDDVYDIPPSATKDTCWFIYDNNHVGLLVHENFMSKESVKILEKRSRDTIVHVIRPKKRKSDKINIVTADIECYRKHDVVDKEMDHVIYMTTHEPLLIGQYEKDNGFTYFRGENAIDEYCAYLSNAEQDWLIWFHNAGKYDTHFLLEPIAKFCDTDLDEPIVLRDLNGKFIEAKCYLKNGRTVTIRDSYSIIPESLKKIAKDMGITQKRQDVDIKNASRKDILYSPKILDYNMDDCKALYDVLCNYEASSLKVFGSNPLQHVSGSSFAKRVFFSDYYDEDNHPIYVLSKHVHEFIAEGYGGGRNEVLQRGRYKNIPIYPYDFTSHYPAVARMELPYGIPRYVDGLDNVKMDRMDDFLEKHPGFYRVDVISSPHDRHPIHGVMHKHKYMFPYLTNYEGMVVFSKELQLGIQNGYKYKLRCGYTMKFAPMCKDFFEKMISVKAKATEKKQMALSWSAKIAANSGYGYFGFDPYDRSVMRIYGKNMEKHVESLSHNGQLSYRKEGDVFICHERTNVLLPDINIAIAAAITSYARMKLWELIQDILDAKDDDDKNGIVYYYDTDSVHSSIDIEKHKILGPKWCGPGKGKKLGELKRELRDEDIIDATYVGCKIYCYRTDKDRYIVKSKGTNNPKPMDKLEDEIPEDELDDWIKNKSKCKYVAKKIQKLVNKPQTFQTENISTSRIRKVREDMKVTDKSIMKKITGEYKKGHLMDDGSIIPYSLTTNNATLDRDISRKKRRDSRKVDDDWEVRFMSEPTVDEMSDYHDDGDDDWLIKKLSDSS